MRFVPLAAIALALAAAAGPALAAPDAYGIASASYDFGDAPDGTPSGYLGKVEVAGKFPAKAASGGPRQTAAGPRLGRAWNAESASRQVDRDADDGGRLDARSCATSTLTVVLDASRVPKGMPVYVNAWFDWNQDGDWADRGSGSCGPEWGVQNHRVDTATLAGKIVLLELRFRAGPVPDDFWWRVQVHTGQPAPHAGGGRQSSPSPGETEDRLFSRPRVVAAERVGLSCSPAAGVLFHGGSHDIHAWLGGTFGRAISILKYELTVLGDKDGVALGPNTRIGNVIRIRVRSTERHELRQPAQSVRVEIEVTASVEGAVRRFKSGCGLLIAHTPKVAPPPVGQASRGPAVTLPTGSVVDPDRPTPASARCGGNLERSDALGYFFADTSCGAVDIKSTTYWASEVPIVPIGGFNALSRSLLSGCEEDPAATSVKCLWKPANKGRTVTYVFAPVTFPRRVTLNVLAGGTGTTGTATVLRQDYMVLDDGTLRCSQSIPRAAQCTKPPAG